MTVHLETTKDHGSLDSIIYDPTLGTEKKLRCKRDEQAFTDILRSFARPFSFSAFRNDVELVILHVRERKTLETSVSNGYPITNERGLGDK